MTDDKIDFAAEMSKNGVKPLAKRQKKLVKQQSLPSLRELARHRESFARSERYDDDNLVHDRGIQWLSPEEVVEHKPTGIQLSVFKKLKRGEVDKSATLDLHGCRVNDARDVLLEFLRDCTGRNIRSALVIHGKGYHAKPVEEDFSAIRDRVARLKSHVVYWLKAHPNVLAFCSAQAKDGGTGALYVLLRKSPEITART
jgi:DNA-nicking Smr family endonuclease